ncbi:L10-interacting MYB domain-containing protein-like [Wolffia australiana]
MASTAIEHEKGEPDGASIEKYDAHGTIVALQKQVRSLKRRLQIQERENQTLVSRMSSCRHCHKMGLIGKLSAQCKANWTDEYKKAFIDICLDEARKGNRPSTSFNRAGWVNITERFNEFKGTKYVKGQFKNLYAVMRDSWREWKSLVNRSNGWGWDSVSQSVDCDPQTWEEYCKSHKHAKQFLTRPMVYEEELDELFGGVGPSDGETLCLGDSDVTGALPRPAADEFEPSCQMVGQEGAERTKFELPRVQPARQFVSRKRKKGRAGAGGVVPPPSPSAAEVIRLLDRVEGVEMGGDLYMRALKVLRGATEREFFVAMDPRIRFAWLRNVIYGDKPS